MTEQSHNLSASLPSLLSSKSTTKPPVVEWLKAPDGAKLGCRVWLGKDTAPVIIYLHGIEGHSKWFENTACVLNEQGITIYAPDRRGSGMNGSLRGHLENYSILLTDLESQIRYIRKNHRGQRVILVANCWSAKIAALFAQSNYQSTDNSTAPPLAGLVLIGPAIYTRTDFPLFTKIKIAISWMLGSHSLLKYWTIPISTQMLTNNPTFVEFLDNDPLRITKATTSFFVQTFFLSKKAQQAAKFIKLPVLILQGEEDLIVDTQKLETWYQQLASTDKTIHAFPGGSHSLDFDSSWFKEYAHVLTEWILVKGQWGA